jgi:MFS family permease
MFRALRSRNFRLFFLGQGLSLVGTWMQRVAMGWLIYRLTRSPEALGTVDFVSQIAVLLLVFLSGAAADRADLRTLLLWTQGLAMVQAAVLAALTLTGTITYGAILVCGVFLGVVNAFDMPARQAFVVRMVEDRSDLGNAIALNSSLFNLARLVGPSLAGMAIALLGEGICFLMNALSFLGVIAALRAMRPRAEPERPRADRGGLGIREGWAYAWRTPRIRASLLMLTLLSLFGMPYIVLMPVFAREVLRGGPATLGFLLAATGAGALAGALLLAARKDARGLRGIIVLSAGLLALALLGLALVRSPLPAYLLVALAGLGMIGATASCNTAIQTIVEDAYRGRVMSLYTLSLLGMAPFGSLMNGRIAERWGISATLGLGGAVCLIGGILFLLRTGRRPTPPRGAGRDARSGVGLRP